MVILPEFQNRGMGTWLLEETKEGARQRGVPVKLQTQHANRAVELYLRLGFKKTGDTEHHVLMEWNPEDGARVVESPAREVMEAISSHPGVDSVELVGSQKRGDATPLSDWDLRVKTARFEELAPELPALVEPLHPLAAQWDRLSDRRIYMLVFHGPTKVDLLFSQPQQPMPPWEVRADTLGAIDCHFWDWLLWLGSKRLRGETSLVQDELRKMFHHLLEPLGAEHVPHDIDDARASYRSCRAKREQEFGVIVPKELEREVSRVVG